MWSSKTVQTIRRQLSRHMMKLLLLRLLVTCSCIGLWIWWPSKARTYVSCPGFSTSNLTAEIHGKINTILTVTSIIIWLLPSNIIRHYECSSPGYLRGVDVIAETSVLVTNQSQTFHWAGYGLKLHIPQESLPTGSEECRLLIKVGLSGQFALPQTTSLVSAVYWLDSEPRCTYSQPLTVEIQHCVKPIHSSRLSFIRAKCSQTHLPYVFEPIEGGEFSSESSYGCVQLNHFSLLGVGCNDPTSGVQLYRACLFYLNSGANLRDIHFVITWDEEPHTTVSWCALCCMLVTVIIN